MPPKLSFLLLPIPILSLLFFTIGLSLILSILSVYFTDISYIYQIILIAWMYITPIFYPPSIVPEKYKIFLLINPMYHIITNLREVIYLGKFPNTVTIIVSLLFSLIIFLFGLWFFKKK